MVAQPTPQELVSKRIAEGISVMDKVVIWGASGHAKVVADIIRLEGKYIVEGFIDNINKARAGEVFFGAKIFGGDDVLQDLLGRGIDKIIMGFGNCNERLRLSARARNLGFELVSAIHPKSIVAADVQLKPGTVVAAGAVISTSVLIGENVIVNTACSIDHECSIGDGVHISPGVHLAGRVHVGAATWIGIGSCVIDLISIGKGTIIGAGSNVIKDIPDYVVAVGNPARVIKQNSL